METRSSSARTRASLSTLFPVKTIKREVSVEDDSPPVVSPCPIKVTKQGPAEDNYAHMVETPIKEASSTHEPDNVDRTTWQTFYPTTQSKLSYLLYNRVMADIYFLIGKDGCLEEIPAHRFVLAMSSSVFYEMFFGPNPIPDKIDLTDCEPEAVHQVLKYIYTEKVAFNTKTVMNSLLIAKKYRVKTLESACLDFILKDVYSDNAFRRLKEAHDIGDAVVVNRCLETIDKAPTASFSAEEFLEARHDDLCRVLVRSSLKAPEISVFRAAKRWAEAECKRQNILVTPENQRQALSRALFLIRFPLMTVEEFGNEVAISDLLTEKESLQIFKYLSGNHKIALGPFISEPRQGRRSNTRIFASTGCCFRAGNSKPTVDFELCFYVHANHRIHVDGFGFERANAKGAVHEIKISVKRTSGEVLGSCKYTFTTPADGEQTGLFKALFPRFIEIVRRYLPH